MKKKFAIFDIDYTLIPFDSFLYFIAYVIKKRPGRIIYLPYLVLITFLFLCRLFSLTTFKQYWLIVLKGMSLEQIDHYARQFVDQVIIPGLKKGVCEELEAKKKEGYKIIFATASFEFYFKYLAAYFEADFFFGTKMIGNAQKRYIIDGLNCKGGEKIRRIKESVNPDTFDIDQSISYSDSNSDLPFLELSASFYKVDKKQWQMIKVLNR